ncbi:MAG: energy transducer TonB, partial [Lachnospiraceae bacterium]|nr:energy transducer TonB [Lachnospiraceae bacterium]
QYQQLLVVKAVGNRLQPFANNLRRGSLKKRIIMMYQKKSNRWMMLKALFIIPMTCFAIYAFATPEAEVQVQQVKKTAVKQQKKATLTPQKKVTPTPQKSATPTPQKKTATTSQQKVTTVVGEGIPSGEIKPDDHIYDIVEVNAQFPGGDEACMKWIAGHMKYPEEAVKNNIQGRVMVRFTVEKDGEITDVKAVRSPSPLLAEEAERVVKAMPKWKPAKNKGEIVRSTFNLPISFRLSSPQPSKE